MQRKPGSDALIPVCKNIKNNENVRSELAVTLPSPLVLRLLKLFVDVINLCLQLLLPLLWGEV